MNTYLLREACGLQTAIKNRRTNRLQKSRSSLFVNGENGPGTVRVLTVQISVSQGKQPWDWYADYPVKGITEIFYLEFTGEKKQELKEINC